MSNGLQMECQLISNGMPIECQWNANYTTLSNASMPMLGFICFLRIWLSYSNKKFKRVYCQIVLLGWINMDDFWWNGLRGDFGWFSDVSRVIDNSKWISLELSMTRCPLATTWRCQMWKAPSNQQAQLLGLPQPAQPPHPFPGRGRVGNEVNYAIKT